MIPLFKVPIIRIIVYLVSMLGSSDLGRLPYAGCSKGPSGKLFRGCILGFRV